MNPAPSHPALGILPLLCSLILMAAVPVPGAEAGEPAGVDTTHAVEPRVHPTLLWFAAQLLPSPQGSLLSGDGLRFGLRWQITPVLYSFGTHRRVSPWRWFIVDPYARQSGSLELFASPELMNLADIGYGRWAVRTGVRGYIPLWQRGEYLSASVAGSCLFTGTLRGAGYEAGLYFLAGVFGVQVTHTPCLTDAPWTFTLRLKYF